MIWVWGVIVGLSIIAGVLFWMNENDEFWK